MYDIGFPLTHVASKSDLERLWWHHYSCFLDESSFISTQNVILLYWLCKIHLQHNVHSSGKQDTTAPIFRCLFLISSSKFLQNIFLTIIYSKKSHIFALGPGLHKNALGLNTVKRTKNPNKKKQIKIKNKSTTNQLPKKTMQRIFTPYRNRCSLQEMDEKETAGIPWFLWIAFKRQQFDLSLRGNKGQYWYCFLSVPHCFLSHRSLKSTAGVECRPFK